MKRFHFLFTILMALTLTACHQDILNDIDSLESRVTNLEELRDRINANINAIKALMNAERDNDMISGINEIIMNGDTLGYSITLASGKSFLLYNGRDGQDGANGNDATYTPSIGVALYTDGLYYWTLDGQYLLGDDGEKLPVTGPKGDKGEQGSPGADGTDGATPRFKIEDGNWYVSYDGTNWSLAGKANGTNGTDGADGAKGAKGDTGKALFSKVQQGGEYVYFTLADGTVMTLSKYKERNCYTITYSSNYGSTPLLVTQQVPLMRDAVAMACPDNFGRDLCVFTAWNTMADGSGAIYKAGQSFSLNKDITLYAQWARYFSVSASSKVSFAPGNLQYRREGDAWRFAREQYDIVGADNENIIDADYEGWIDLFGWGTADAPLKTSMVNSDYSHTFTEWGGKVIDGYPAGTWRTPTKDEWTYLIKTRPNAAKRKGWGEIRPANLTPRKGYIFLPDLWSLPGGLTFVPMDTATQTINTYTETEWAKMEQAGAVFLPLAGERENTKYSSDMEGQYWSSTVYDNYKYGIHDYQPGYIGFNIINGPSTITIRYNFDFGTGKAVRLIKDL